jgi:hypothetical protein
MLYRIFHRIKEIPGDIKHIYQRATKGYSYRDAWDVDIWFMRIIPKILTDLKHDLRGCPSIFTNDENGKEFQSVEDGVKDWKNILDRMIFCFQEMNEDTCSMKNEYEDEYDKQARPFGKELTTEEIGEDGQKRWRLNLAEVEPELERKYFERLREIGDYREKMKNEGLELFGKYFHYLWS